MSTLSPPKDQVSEKSASLSVSMTSQDVSNASPERTVERKPIPSSPITPMNRFLAQADGLRREIAELILSIDVGECEDPTTIFKNLLEAYADQAIWDAALHSSYHEENNHQDIPIVEAACRDQYKLIDCFLTMLPLQPKERSKLLEAPGRYGRSALAHAVRLGSWRAANMLIRHGASIGHSGDSTGIISGILRATRKQRKSSGSWRGIDKNLSRCFITISSLYGEKWATSTETPTTAQNDSLRDPDKNRDFSSANVPRDAHGRMSLPDLDDFDCEGGRQFGEFARCSVNDLSRTGSLGMLSRTGSMGTGRYSMDDLSRMGSMGIGTSMNLMQMAGNMGLDHQKTPVSTISSSQEKTSSSQQQPQQQQARRGNSTSSQFSTVTVDSTHSHRSSARPQTSPQKHLMKKKVSFGRAATAASETDLESSCSVQSSAPFKSNLKSEPQARYEQKRLEAAHKNQKSCVIM